MTSCMYMNNGSLPTSPTFTLADPCAPSSPDRLPSSLLMTSYSMPMTSLSPNSSPMAGLSLPSAANLTSLHLPNIAQTIQESSGANMKQEPKESPQYILVDRVNSLKNDAKMATIFSNSLNGQLEINKQLMTCLSVALEEIKDLRKQLADRDQTAAPEVSHASPTIPLSTEVTPSSGSGSKPVNDSGVSTPASMSPFHSEQQQHSPASLTELDLKSLFKIEADWVMPGMQDTKLDQSFRSPQQGGKRLRGDKLKSNVPAACRSIVKNVYRELVRRDAINAFDLHQGQESPHNVKIYWQVIEYIKKTNSNCLWQEADMLYAIRTYWRSLRDDRQRELSGKKYNHRRMIIRREIMKRKLKSRQKAIALVNWTPGMKDHFGETLSLDYMSSEEEDNTVESREGPRARVVRRIPWESETMTKCKAELDCEFKKICSARQLKATAHVYRRPTVQSTRTRPNTCPQWATDANWVPEIMVKDEKQETERPSMLTFNKDGGNHPAMSQQFNTNQILGLSDEILKSFRQGSPLDPMLDDMDCEQESTNTDPQESEYPDTTKIEAPVPLQNFLPMGGPETCETEEHPNDNAQPIQLYPLTAVSSLPINFLRSPEPAEHTISDNEPLPFSSLSSATNVTMSTNVTMATSMASSVLPGPAVKQSHNDELLSSLNEADRALFDSVVRTLVENNPGIHHLNPVDIIMSLGPLSDIGSLLGTGDQGN